jgi:hypothetical protein
MTLPELLLVVATLSGVKLLAFWLVATALE